MSSKYLVEPIRIEMLEERGYLVIRVGDELALSVNSIYALGRAFFRSSKSIKQKNAIPSINEGWKDLGGEFSVAAARPDLHESFWVTQKRQQNVATRYSPDGLRLYGEMFRCISMLNEIERGITADLMRYLGVGADATTFRCDRDSDMQILYYQPSIHTRDLLQDPHDDSLYLTFAKADSPGLEILDSKGDYHPVRLAPNEILIMPGEILSLISGYRITPLIHKVVRHPEQNERMALGYFTLPNIELGGTLRPWIANGSNANIDIMARLIHNQNQFLIP